MKLHEWLSMSYRRSGKTHNLAKLVKELNGTLFVRNRIEANRINKEYGIRAISINDYMDSWRGTDFGISYIDPDACLGLVENETKPLFEEIKRLEKLAGEIADINKDIISYKEQGIFDRIIDLLNNKSSTPYVGLSQGKKMAKWLCLEENIEKIFK